MGISTGVDNVEIERMKRLLEKHPSGYAHRRIFCDSEIADCEKKGAVKYQSYAVRFAAKEAVAKALGTGLGEHCALTDICIRNNATGQPYVTLSGKAKITYDRQEGAQISVSLSHTRESAVAFVIIVKGD